MKRLLLFFAVLACWNPASTMAQTPEAIDWRSQSEQTLFRQLQRGGPLVTGELVGYGIIGIEQSDRVATDATFVGLIDFVETAAINERLAETNAPSFGDRSLVLSGPVFEGGQTVNYVYVFIQRSDYVFVFTGYGVDYDPLPEVIASTTEILDSAAFVSPLPAGLDLPELLPGLVDMPIGWVQIEETIQPADSTPVPSR